MKTVLYNPKAGKKATNVSINSDLLKQAKALSARYTVRSSRYTCHPRGCPTGRWENCRKTYFSSQPEIPYRRYTGDHVNGGNCRYSDRRGRQKDRFVKRPAQWNYCRAWLLDYRFLNFTFKFLIGCDIKGGCLKGMNRYARCTAASRVEKCSGSGLFRDEGSDH